MLSLKRRSISAYRSRLMMCDGKFVSRDEVALVPTPGGTESWKLEIPLENLLTTMFFASGNAELAVTLGGRHNG